MKHLAQLSILISLCLVSCRKDEADEVPNETEIEYSGVYLLNIDETTTEDLSGAVTEKFYDEVVTLSHDESSVFFRGQSYSKDEIGQLIFRDTTISTGFLSRSELTLNNNLDKALFDLFIDNDNAGLTIYTQTFGNATNYADPVVTGVHPRKNEIDGQYAIVYSQLSYDAGVTSSDTTYHDTINVSIDLHSQSEYDLNVGGQSFILPFFVSHYDNIRTSSSCTIASKFVLNGNALLVRYTYNCSGIQSYSMYEYSGHKL